MNHKDFGHVLKDQLSSCDAVLGVKSAEYATSTDKLHNFKVAAALQGITPIQALGGMMAKHTVSIFDLIKKDELAHMSLWDEKITDHINYLILLKALVVEAHEQEEGSK